LTVYYAMSFITKHKTAIIVGSCVLGAFALLLLSRLVEPIQVMWQMGKTDKNRERQLLYETDHAALASELRNFARQERWHSPEVNAEPQIFWQGDEAIPASIRRLEPTSVTILDDRVIFERGGPMLHFGIVVFRDGIAGEGLKELAPGVWFYAENQRIPGK
jgi:hypothetical protein